MIGKLFEWLQRQPGRGRPGRGARVMFGQRRFGQVVEMHRAWNGVFVCILTERGELVWRSADDVVVVLRG